MPNSSLTASSAPRLGSRSPNSIPSSPTSVHSGSSSSAIFERDIEPIPCPSPPHQHGHNSNHPNPHRRTPRSKVNEQLDQSVPSVLDSAAAILLASSIDDDQISIVSPAKDHGFGGGLRSGITSPIGSLRSRSPSPSATGAGAGAGRRTSLLLSIPSPPLQTNVPHTVASNPPATACAPANISIRTSSGTEQPNLSTPSIVTPTSMYYSVASSAKGDGDGEGTSPTTTTREHPPSSFPTNLQSQSTAVPLNLSHPPSPITSPLSLASASGGDKRLSFMSYTDLLASTPASLQPLSSFTTSASTAEPPPHIPSVSGITQAQAQFHSHSPSHSPGRRSLVCAAGVIEGRGAGDGDSVFEDAGGEWEREGMGSGLEERLEALLGPDSPEVRVLPVQLSGKA